jgi:hypothetical protein
MAMTGERESLWVPVIAPALWAVHFTICYIWIAVACGRFATVAGVEQARAGIGVLTGAAVAAMVVCFIRGYRRHGHGLPDRSNDDGTVEDRSRFMAYTTMLLAALSLIATIFVGYAVMAMGGCG